jgi:outer membrane receptor protein involved in Fe transport
VGDAHSTGLTAEVDWIPSERWSIGANAQFLNAEVDSTTSDDRAGIEKGQELPNTPEFQGALWATYTWPVRFVEGGEMFIRGQYSYTGETHTRLVPAVDDPANPSFDNDAYGIADLRIGLVGDRGDWQVDLFASNITDERAQVWQGATTGGWAWSRSGEYDHVLNVYTVRPREFGARFSMRWGN